MSRGALARRLADLAGPLGPFTTPDGRWAAEAEFLASLDGSVLDDLLAIFAEPGAAGPPDPDDRAAFDRVLCAAVARAGRADPERVLAAAAAALPDPAARRTAIDLLGALRHPGASAPLAELLATAPLDDDERERVACALGDIATPEAVAVLTWMADQPYAPSVADEVTLALERAAEAAG